MFPTTCSIAIRLMTLSLLVVFGASAALAQTKAYVTNEAEGTVSVINTATNTVIATVEVGIAPLGIAVTPDGTFAYVTNPLSNTLSVISGATDTVVATVPVPADAGTLTQNQADGLIDKLNQVITKLANGQTGAACNQLSTFINHVNSLVNNGALTQAEAQPLIDAANAIRASNGC
jgi:YVTN family beta-propeller protein